MAIVLAAASVLPLNLDSIVIQEDQILGLSGHFIIIAEDPDRMQYIQTDNIILADGLDVAGLELFGAQTGGPFDEIRLSGDVIGLIGSTPTNLLVNTGTIQGTYTLSEATIATGDCGSVTTTCEQITGAPTQIDVSDAQTIIKSVALGNTAGKFLAWSTLSPTLQVTPGTTTVTITYKIEMG